MYIYIMYVNATKSSCYTCIYLLKYNYRIQNIPNICFQNILGQNCLKVFATYQRLYFKKLESPCPKLTPCQISVHANGSWEEDFRRFIKIFLIQPLYLNKSESPSQSCFLPSLVEIGLVVLEKNFF